MKPLTLSTTLASLEALDALPSDVLVLSLQEEDRPLRGSAGYCDWRLNGRLSRLLQGKAFGAGRGEVLLTDTGGRVGASRVILFGWGKRRDLDGERAQAGLRRLVEVLRKALLSRAVIDLPDVEGARLSQAQMISTFLDAAAGSLSGAEITLLCPSARVADLTAEIAASDRRISFRRPQSAAAKR